MIRSARHTRRMLLKSLGLGAACLPLLHVARGWGAVTFPKRLIILQPCNGFRGDAFWPSGTDTNFTLGEITSPLEPHKADVILPRGIGIKVQGDDNQGAPGNPFSGYGGHATLPYLLTGARSAVGQGEGEPYPVANSISIDQHVAKAFAGQTPISSLELGGIELDRLDGARSLSFRGPASGSPARPQENRPEISPGAVFKRLLGVANPTAAPDPTTAKTTAEQRAIWDSVLGDIKSLRSRIPTEDRPRLDSHLQFVQQLQSELTQIGKPVACGDLGSGPMGFRDSAADGLQFDKLVKAQLDNIIVALSCDITRVVTFSMYGPGNNLASFGFLGSLFQGGALHDDTGSAPKDFISHHEIAHNQGGNGTDDRRRKILSDQWHISQLAYLIARLKQIPEGDRTLFDNCAILMANNMSDGGAHSVNELPWVLAGSCGGYFATGRYLRVGDGMVPHNQILVGLCNALGAPPPVSGGNQYFGDAAYGGELPGLRA
jgi:Protein of unknown function (DUF1552)